MATDALIFGIGLLLAGGGGELFVRGLVGLAGWLRLTHGTVALTLAAFATSSPELAVSTNAALDGRPQLGLGDALGSNVVNLGLILGLSLVFAEIRVLRAELRRDLAVAATVPALIALAIVDGVVSRLDGALLLGLFAGWLTAVAVEAGRRRSAVERVLGEPRRALTLAYALGGFAMLLAAGRLIVVGGTGVAMTLGLDPFIVGATIVAVGTSVPELATTLIASWRGHGEISLGTILGSNIFNGLFIVGVAAAIHPIAIGWQEVVVALGFGALVTLAVVPERTGRLGRRRGTLLLAFYAAYAVMLIQLGP